MKMRGFLVKQRVATSVFRSVIRRHRSSAAAATAYQRLEHSPSSWREKSNNNSSLFSRVKSKATKAICSLGWSRISGGRKAIEEKAVAVPKGHLAVYVGQNDGDFKRILVPVMYFNDPLFGELLREAEDEFGFSHPGGITIPCRISEFERVQTRIKQGRAGQKLAITTH